MKGYRNYRVTLEHVTDREIDVVDSVEVATEKQARAAAIKMSKSNRAKKLLTEKNNWGELPNEVRVFCSSCENDNDRWVHGSHIMIYENGICTHDVVTG